MKLSRESVAQPPLWKYTAASQIWIPTSTSFAPFIAYSVYTHSLPRPFTITNSQLITAETKSPFTHRNHPSEFYRLPKSYRQAAVPNTAIEKDLLILIPIPTHELPKLTSYHNLISSTHTAGRKQSPTLPSITTIHEKRKKNIKEARQVQRISLSIN